MVKVHKTLGIISLSTLNYKITFFSKQPSNVPAYLRDIFVYTRQAEAETSHSKLKVPDFIPSMK